MSTPDQSRGKALKIALLIVIISVLLVAGVLITSRIVYLSTDSGVETQGKRPYTACVVSQPALDKAKVSVSTEGTMSGDFHFSCTYETRKGSDGGTSSKAEVTVTKAAAEAVETNADSVFDEFSSGRTMGNPIVLEADYEFGSHRKLSLATIGKETFVDLYVLNGTILYKITYSSSTKGFFSDRPTSADAVEVRVLTIARDIEDRLEDCSALPSTGQTRAQRRLEQARCPFAYED
ncbi:hypothetical protein [Kibdelosporangium aridum]|uniref:Uncharacterized protein n=1 Tax=Kibdelosporangium aridum TaxID=2030 RepID=A0A1W2FYV9_KIBAR|nr:hypothetical protein [Kibdelosporangium aridum]SMD27120.1 hypothetical protein SAMN05661093_10717 [Kibdelosporangium aridum]